MKKFGFIIGILLITVALTACPPTKAASEQVVASLNGASEVSSACNASSVTAELKDGKLIVSGSFS